MKKFTISVKYVFNGLFEVKAENREEALRIVKEDCGMTLGNIHTTDDEAVKGWNFDMHPELIISHCNK